MIVIPDLRGGGADRPAAGGEEPAPEPSESKQFTGVTFTEHLRRAGARI